MVAGGVKNVLLSNEIIGIERFERMATHVEQDAQVTLIFDHADAIQQANLVASRRQVHFDALVDVNVGQDRCGVDTVEQALSLARLIDASSHLRLRGIQAYHGSAQHIRQYQDKQEVIQQVSDKAQRVRNALQENKLCCDIITGGGTGTYLLEAASGIFTEVQPGSYLFNDADYARNLDCQGQLVRDWEQSLFVLTTVMSTNSSSSARAVVDAGMKAVSLDSGPPTVYSSVDSTPLPPLQYQGGGDEHGILIPNGSSAIPMPRLGQKILLIPGHCDPTTNLYDFVVGFRNGVVEHVWEIAGRGPGN